MVGPSFKGLYSRKRNVIGLDGKEREVTADDTYLIESIKDPGIEVVKGYPPAMPKNDLSGAELQQVVESIKALR